MVNRWKIKKALMKADSTLENDDADYITEELFKNIEFDFSPEAAFGLMIMCAWIGFLLGTLKF